MNEIVESGFAYQSRENDIESTDNDSEQLVGVRARRLNEIFAVALRRAIAIVVAPAGFGKTTAIREYLATLQDCFYLRVLPKMTLERFIVEFASVLSLPSPETSIDSSQILAESSKALEVYEVWATWHLRNKYIVIAVDDLHNGSDSRIIDFIVEMTDSTKDSVKWLLSTRSARHLPVARWTAYADSDKVIGANDFLVTIEDAVGIARAVASPASLHEIQTWLKQCAGFIVPIAYALRQSAQRKTTVGIIDGTRSITFNFIAEEIWASIPNEHKELLEIAALLPSLHFHMFDASELPDTSSAIHQLSNDFVFISVDESGIFSVHDFFRDFIKRQISLAGKDYLRKCIDRALAILVRNGDINRASSFLMEIGDTDRLIRLFSDPKLRITDPIIANDVISTLRTVPHADLPSSLMALAVEQESWFGDPRELRILAENLLNRDNTDSQDIFCAIEAMYRTTDFVSFAEHASWVEQISGLSSKLRKEHYIQTRALQARSLARIGSTFEARLLINEVEENIVGLSRLARTHVMTSLTVAHFFLGDHDSAVRLGRDAAASSMRTGDIKEQARTMNNLGLTLTHGYSDEVEELFTPLRNCVEKTGAWKFSHISHWYPAVYYAWLGDEMRAAENRELHDSVLVLGDFDKARLRAIRRHACNLGHFITGDFRAIIVDHSRGDIPERLDDAYDLLTEVALAYSLLGEFGNSEKILRRVQEIRKAFSPLELSSMRQTIFVEIVAHAAHGNWTTARRILKSSKSGISKVSLLEDALTTFCDGPPFVSLNAQLDACKGKPYIGLIAKLIQNVRERLPSGEGPTSLSPVEMDVLRGISLGQSNKEIADARQRSSETVKRQLSAIYRKLGTENRTSTVAIARERGLIP